MTHQTDSGDVRYYTWKQYYGKLWFCSLQVFKQTAIQWAPPKKYFILLVNAVIQIG